MYSVFRRFYADDFDGFIWEHQHDGSFEQCLDYLKLVFHGQMHTPKLEEYMLVESFDFERLI